jgi:PEP-CTERM/exosortase A-associated glycosyltransferase
MAIAQTPDDERDRGTTSATNGKHLKIFHIFDHSLPMLSGYSVRSAAILRAQHRRGWQTIHLTTPKHTAGGPSPECIDGLRFHRSRPLPKFTINLPAVREFVLVRRLAQEIERIARLERPNIIHAHSPALNGVAALWAARRLGLPVVYEVRAFWEDAAVDLGTAVEGGVRYRLTRAMETYVLRRCHAAATICEGLRRDIVGRGVAPDRISIIANGVEIEEFPFRGGAELELKAKAGLKGRVVLGFLGSFYSYEGLDLLLSALPMIRQRDPSIALLLVGSGPAESALKEQAAQLRLGDSVRFAGRVPRETIQDYYRLIDIFVYPRHRMRLTETVTPLKPLEAMAQGGIVLASDVGGHSELIVDGATGRLFPADSREGLVEAILRLAADRAAWTPMRDNARAFVERERTWTATTRAYDIIYDHAQQMCKGTKDPPGLRRAPGSATPDILGGTSP